MIDRAIVIENYIPLAPLLYESLTCSCLSNIQLKEEILFILELTDTLITAQAFVFFLAGFETSSSTISHALYELSQRQDIQDKLRQEINDSLAANNGELTYDNVKEMKYLHMVFQGMNISKVE